MTRRSLHIGSAMIDIITLIASENIERATFANDKVSFLMLETGRKLPAEQITTHVGGGACNTAVSLARQGWAPDVLAKIGRDLNAGAVREHLGGNGVGDRLVESDHATGTAVMVASHDRNASIFIHRGANEHLTVADLPDPSGYDLVYVSALSNASAECFGPILSRARQAGVLTAANPGIRQLTSRTAEVLDALGNLDLLSINRVEAEALLPALATRTPPGFAPISSDIPPLLRDGLQAGGLRLGLREACAALRNLGPKWVLITDGLDGAWLAAPDGLHWCASAPAEVAGTAGAGDAYCSTLTASLAEGTPPAEAMRLAAINAASVVSHVDTTTGLLERAALASQNMGLSQKHFPLI
ncbi:MAG: carbohydrate kinase family protein [Pseudomonadota bacterium]